MPRYLRGEPGALDELATKLKWTCENVGFFYIENMGDPGQLWEFDETDKMFSSPNRKETEDYVTGRFG